ncbi:MAG: CinA family protein [Pseudomonadota bacterium]
MSKNYDGVLQADTQELAATLGKKLLERKLKLVTAESCTGGLLAAELTAQAGSSAWFEGAFVAYRLSAKQSMLGINPELLKKHGAVSKATVTAMAVAALAHSDAEVSVAITGIAGPDGATAETPMGTVWLAWTQLPPNTLRVRQFRFPGDRQAVRVATVRQAVQGVLECLNSPQ